MIHKERENELIAFSIKESFDLTSKCTIAYSGRVCGGIADCERERRHFDTHDRNFIKTLGDIIAEITTF